MKIICTTSNKNKHIVPIFCYLFNLNWSKDQRVEIVGYDNPTFPEEYPMPSNFTFHSLGKQIGGPESFGTDLRKYFEQQDEWFMWFMEDYFIREVDLQQLEITKSLTTVNNVGRINLTLEGIRGQKIENIEINGINAFNNLQDSPYRLSTQPSIWNKKYLLKYLTPGLTPWKFETQHSINDGWMILGTHNPAVRHNEGVTKHDLHCYNFHKISEEVIQEMKDLKII